MKTELNDYQTQATIVQFIEAHGITLDAVPVPTRPDKSEWDDRAKHYFCILDRDGAGVLKLYYSMGSAHKTGPKIEDVLDCLASDANCESDTFEDFCANLGYDEDSRKAFATWEAVRDQTSKLRKFLTPEQFTELLNLERL